MIYYIQLIINFLSEKLALKLAAALAVVFLPFVPACLALMVLIMIDFVTGVLRSTHTIFHEVNPQGLKAKISLFLCNLQSRKLRYTVEKTATYGLAILAFAFFQTHLLPIEIGGYGITKVVIGIFGLIEIKSICENLSSISHNPLFTKIFSIFETKVKEVTQVDTTIYTQSQAEEFKSKENGNTTN
jgi:hypothetical protein